jgi:hypothetical protein
MNLRRGILILIVISTCLGLYLITKSIMEVNERYPTPSVTIHSMSDSLSVPNSEGVSFRVKEARCLSKDEIAVILPETYQDMREWAPGDFVAIVLLIDIENTSEKRWTVQPFRESMLSIGKTYSNGLDLPAIIEFSGDDVVVEIEAQESKEVPFIYTVIEPNLSQKTWQDLCEQDFYFVYRLYPAIEKVSLDVKWTTST